MKRFYTQVTVASTDTGYEIHLDGKPVNTPERQRLTSPCHKLADTMAAEWRMQEDEVLPESMPLSQLMMTVIDRVTPNRERLEQEILGYLDTDLIFYRTADPPETGALQQERWDPVLEWFDSSFGVKLKTTTDLMGLKQPASAHERVADIIRKADDLDFAELYLTTTESGSVLLSLAHFMGAITAEDVYAASFVEEDIKYDLYMGDTYGEAPDLEKRRARFRKDMETLTRLRDIKSAQQI
ncbi:MAG: ATP12 family protein [Pseudobdellovibrionaceae bacterium]